MIVGNSRPNTTRSLADRLGFVFRAALAVTAIAAMALVLFMVWHAVASYAQHLCGWPATMSCDEGTPLWWLVPIGLSGIALVAAWGLIRWVRFGFPRSPWIAVAWLIGFGPLVIRLRPRTFSGADLWVEVLYVLAGVSLAGIVAVQCAPTHKQLIVRVTSVTLIAAVAIATALPSILSAR